MHKMATFTDLKKTPLATVEEITLTGEPLTHWQQNICQIRLQARPPVTNKAMSLRTECGILERASTPFVTLDLKEADINQTSRCPVAKEYQKIQDTHGILASTGCSQQFCQAGRAVHSDEPRIGENRALNVVKDEAEAFLRELHRENYFNGEEAFDHRLRQVLLEIENGACEGVVRETKQRGLLGGSWEQTSAELEFGVRRAWRNSRKCIMRSHCEELR